VSLANIIIWAAYFFEFTTLRRNIIWAISFLKKMKKMITNTIEYDDNFFENLIINKFPDKSIETSSQ